MAALWRAASRGLGGWRETVRKGLSRPGPYPEAFGRQSWLKECEWGRLDVPCILPPRHQTDCLEGAGQIKAWHGLPWGPERLRVLIFIPSGAGAPSRPFSPPHPQQPLIWFDVSFSLLPRQEGFYLWEAAPAQLHPWPWPWHSVSCGDKGGHRSAPYWRTSRGELSQVWPISGGQ